MFQFFDQIIAFLETIVTFVVNMFSTLIYVFVFIFNGVSYVFTCIAYLPAWVMPFVAAVIGLSVVMFLINR